MHTLVLIALRNDTRKLTVRELYSDVKKGNLEGSVKSASMLDIASRSTSSLPIG